MEGSPGYISKSNKHSHFVYVILILENDNIRCN